MTAASPADGDPPEDVDAAFEEIVAGLAREKDALEVAHPRRDDSADPTSDPTSTDAAPSEQDGSAGTGDEQWADVSPPAPPPPAVPEERFVPPEPAPLPRSDAVTAAAWVAVIAAPALFIVLGAAGVALHTWQLAVLAVAFVGSFGLLVSRMRTGRGPDDPDDGAVV